jgi:hypothetical protein
MEELDAFPRISLSADELGDLPRESLSLHQSPT